MFVFKHEMTEVQMSKPKYQIKFEIQMSKKVVVGF